MDQVTKRNARKMYEAALDKLDSARLLKESGKYNDSLSRVISGRVQTIIFTKNLIKQKTSLLQ